MQYIPFDKTLRVVDKELAEKLEAYYTNKRKLDDFGLINPPRFLTNRIHKALKEHISETDRFGFKYRWVVEATYRQKPYPALGYDEAYLQINIQTKRGTNYLEIFEAKYKTDKGNIIIHLYTQDTFLSKDEKGIFDVVINSITDL